MSGIVDDIQISKIRHPKNQLRDAGNNISGLTASIAEKGLLQPIIVRPVESNLFEIVAGNRRYEACKSIGLRKITCHIEVMNDKEAYEISLVENIQRNTLNPIEEGRAFREYISNQGWGGATELASKLSKSVSYVTKRVALLELPEDVIASISKSVLSTSVGEELSSIRDSSKKSKLAQLVAQRHLSVRKVRQLKELENNVKEIDDRFFCGNGKQGNPNSELQKPVEKAILILRMAMNRLGMVIENVDDDGWPIRESLMHHKDLIHSQIDILIKEKKKCDHKLFKVMK